MTNAPIDHHDAPAGQWVQWTESLGDTTRLRLLRLLERQELSVAELCDVLQLPQSTVSRHLKLLSNHGWLSARRQGTTNLYRMLLDELEEPARKLWVMARQYVADAPWVTQDELRLQHRLRQRRQHSDTFFQDAAGNWARTRRELYGQAFYAQALLALLPEDWIVADLGCGIGDMTVSLASHVKQVIGVDQSQAMLDAAREQTSHMPNIALHQAPLQALPLDDACCDAAIMLIVLTYIHQPLPALLEMFRILKPAGRAVVIDLMHHDRSDFAHEMGQHHLGFKPEQLTSLMRQAGFTNPRCQALPPEPQVKGPALLLATGQRPFA